MANDDVSEEQTAHASPAPGAVGLGEIGEIGQVHAAAVRQSRSARLVSVADTVPELLPPFRAEGVRTSVQGQRLGLPRRRHLRPAAPGDRGRRAGDDAAAGPHL